MLADLGVRFTIVRPLPKTYIDGVALHVNRSPMIALTLRYDRIDAFWFTLMHEIAHIVAKHTQIHLDALYDRADEDEDAQEEETHRMARAWLLDSAALADFVKEAGPYFAESRIRRFAASQRRHPGIVLGCLQHDGHVDYKILRRLLVKVSPYLRDWIDAPKGHTG
ncbi:MAG: ImmA/IrrE family metallo-endopeptidase [Chloroflexi bacterium]|nr:ImmA/IrrE family metallo-endopeptidase [Chloroflexota bacterium]